MNTTIIAKSVRSTALETSSAELADAAGVAPLKLLKTRAAS
jgi:hypothetical protein